MSNGKRSAFDALFAPRSVAIVGASADIEKLSGKPLDNLLKLGYRGLVYPINPRASEIGGVRCYAGVDDLPETPDLAFMVLPAEQSVVAAWECGKRGVPAAIVAVSGFRESGTPEGARLEDELRRIVRETGMRILGPNCNGLYNARLGISLGYNAAHAEVIPPGPLTIISHSGALFSAFSGRARDFGLGFGAFVSIGNEADLNLLDLFEWAIRDPECGVIGLVIEAILEGGRFHELVERARGAGKEVIALKLGVSDVGHAATAAHSSRLAGRARAYTALFSQAGAIQATTPEGLITAAALLSDPGAARGRALAALTTTGAGGAVLADAAARYGVPFAELTETTRSAFEKYRRFAPVINPVDVGATGPASTEALATALAADPGVGALVLYATLLLRVESRANVARGVCAARASSGKPVVVLAPGGLSQAEEETYDSAGVPVLRDTAACFEGLAALCSGGGEEEAALTPTLSQRERGRCGILSLWEREKIHALLHQGRPLTEPESHEVLRAIGVPVVEGRTAHDEAGAVAAATALGWPVVLKGVVPGGSHKTDLGLVLLGVRDEAAVRDGFRTLEARADEAGVRLDAVQVQPELRGRLEALVGFTEEPGIGKVLVAGLGGVYAEALDQTAVWVVPATAEQLRRGLRGSALGRVVTSARWPEPDTLDRLLEVLLALQSLALDREAGVAAVDVNPLLLGDRGAIALDALVVPKSAS